MIKSKKTACARRRSPHSASPPQPAAATTTRRPTHRPTPRLVPRHPTGTEAPAVPRPRPAPRPQPTARRRPTAPPPAEPAATPPPASAMPSSAWCTTSPVAATSRSTTPPAPVSTRRPTDLGVTVASRTPTGDGDRAERVQGLVDDGNGLVIGVGFLFGDSITAGGRRQPRHQLRDHRLGRRRPQRGVARRSPRSRARSWSVPPRH